MALHWRHPRERRRADVPKPSRPLPRGYHAKALGVLVRTFANEHQIPEARARLWVSYIALGGALERTNAKSSAPIYVIKGGVALELRLRERARATKDIDISVRVDRPDLIDHFTAAIAARFINGTARAFRLSYHGVRAAAVCHPREDGSWSRHIFAEVAVTSANLVGARSTPSLPASTFAEWVRLAERDADVAFTLLLLTEEAGRFA